MNLITFLFRHAGRFSNLASPVRLAIAPTGVLGQSLLEGGVVWDDLGGLVSGGFVGFIHGKTVLLSKDFEFGFPLFLDAFDASLDNC